MDGLGHSLGGWTWGVLVGSWLNVSQWWAWVAKKESEGGTASPLGRTQHLLQRHSQKMHTSEMGKDRQRTLNVANLGWVLDLCVSRRDTWKRALHPSLSFE